MLLLFFLLIILLLFSLVTLLRDAEQGLSSSTHPLTRFSTANFADQRRPQLFLKTYMATIAANNNGTKGTSRQIALNNCDAELFKRQNYLVIDGFWGKVGLATCSKTVKKCKVVVT